jgi:hypothetical protein
MSQEDFIECARKTIGDSVDAWDQTVIQPLVELSEWYDQQSGPVQTIFAGIVSNGGEAAITFLAAIVGVAAGPVLLAVLGSFAGGVGIGNGLLVMIECSSSL